MATKTIDHMNLYVAITGYRHETVPDQTFDCLRVYVNYRKYRGFVVGCHPGWGDGSMWGCVMGIGDTDPMTAGIEVLAIEATKNNAKRITEMHNALNIAKNDIAWLFNERMWPELRQFVKDVALYGYTYGMENRIQDYKRAKKFGYQTNNNSNNQNSTTMEKTFKAADLIGKVIVLGDNVAKYIVKSVDGDKLSCDFIKEGMEATPMSVSFKQVEKFIADGKWTVSETESATVIGGVVVATEEHHDITTEADVAEVDDIVPVVTKKEETHPQPLPVKGGESEKPKQEKTHPQPLPVKGGESGKPKQEKTTNPTNQTNKGGKYVYATYQTSKGKTGAKITGFASENDVFYAMAADIHASGSYERDKDGNKHYYLCFGPRYAEAAKSICKVLNSDKTINAKVEECKLIVSQATEDLATKREEWKQKREERKAKGYSSEDVAAMLRKVLAGGDVPEDIKKLLQAA